MVATDQKEWRTVVEAKVNNGLKCLRKRNDFFQKKNTEINVMFLEHTIAVTCLY